MSRFCGVCGAARGRPDQRFCSECGTPLAVEATPAAAPPPTPPASVPVTPSAYAPSPGGVADYAVPFAVPRGRAPIGRILAVGALVLALAGAGLVGWQVFGPKGGADSPEAAVREFVTAAVQQDLVGALGLVNPGEVDGLDELYGAARDRLEREGLTEGDAQIADALEISVDNLELDVDELGGGTARVSLRSGDYTVTYHPDRLPERLAFVRDQHPDSRTWSGDIVAELGYEWPAYEYRGDRAEPFVSTVEIDGRWYVTAIGTLAEATAIDELDGGRYDDYGLREPDFDVTDEPLEPIVGEDAEEVLDNIADAIADGDVEALLANFPAEQLGVLRPYAQTLEDALAKDGVRFDVAVSDLDVETSESGDLLKVTVDRATVEASVTGDDYVESGLVGVDGRCLTGSTYDEYYGEYDEEQACMEGEFVENTGVDSVFLMLRRVDGGYQADPLATAVEYARIMIDAVPSSVFDDALAEICYEVQGYDEAGCPS